MSKFSRNKNVIIKLFRILKHRFKIFGICCKLLYLIVSSNNKNQTKINKLVWFGAYGNTNIGDDLVFFSLKKYIPKNIIISLSCKQIRPTTNYGVDVFDRRNSVECKKRIKQYDALWVGGGGLFECYANSYSEGWVLSHLEPLVYAMHYGKPYAIIGVGCNKSPIPNKMIRYIFRKVCNNADFIITRDNKSKVGFENNGVKNNRLMAGLDPVINFMPPVRNLNANIKTVGLLAWPFYMWPHFHSQTDINSIYKSMSSECVEKHQYFIDELKLLIGLLKQNNFNVKFPVFHFSDTTLLDELNIPFKTRIPNIDDYISQIKECDLIISMRYHGLITSVLCGKPVIAISVQEKMYAFTDTFNMKYNEIGIEYFTAERIIDKVNNINMYYENECDKLRSILLSKQNEIGELYSTIIKDFFA